MELPWGKPTTVPTKTSELENDGADGVHLFITLEDVQPLPDNIVIDANYVHTDNNLTDGLVTEIGKVADKQNATDNGLNTTSKNVVGAINEVRGLCLEIPIGLVFATFSSG